MFTSFIFERASELPTRDFSNFLLFKKFADFYNFMQLNVKNCYPSKQIFSNPLALQRVLAISDVEKLSRALSKFLKFPYTYAIILLSFKSCGSR